MTEIYEFRIDVNNMLHASLIAKLQFRSSIYIVAIQDHLLTNGTKQRLLILFRQVVDEPWWKSFQHYLLMGT